METMNNTGFRLRFIGFKNIIYGLLIFGLIFGLIGGVSALPDMAVANLSYSPENPVECENLTLNVTVKNFGDNMTNSSRVYIYLDGVNTMRYRGVNLAANVSSDYLITLESDDTCNKTGLHNLTARVDISDSINEGNESNNEMWVMVNFTGNNKPAVKYLSLAGGYHLPSKQTFGNNSPNNVGALYAKVDFNSCPNVENKDNCTGINVSVKATITDASSGEIIFIKNLTYNHTHGIWTSSFNAADKAIPGGDYTITWNITESYGVSRIFENIMSFSVDRTPPVIESIGCIDGFNISVHIEDPSGVKSATFWYTVDDGKPIYYSDIPTYGHEIVDTTVSRPEIGWSLNIKYYITASDKIGNTATAEIIPVNCIYTITMRPRPPTVAIQPPVVYKPRVSAPGAPGPAPSQPPVNMTPFPPPPPPPLPIPPIIPPDPVPPIPPPIPPTIPVVPVMANASIVNYSY